ncbi:hypothetical protein H0N95_01520 [Candidatus Micrarchaeota archaeon]|nr:hypothetical protein [Candidatus Micrarchaeota archaeon]
MKPDLYLGGEKQEYVKYSVPKNYERFLSKRRFFAALAVITIILLTAEMIH